MTQNQLLEKISLLEIRLKKLLEAYNDCKSELKEYKNENEILSSELDFKNAELKNFQNQHKISKIATVISADKKIAAEYKLKINDYIKEVEKALAYINKI